MRRFLASLSAIALLAPLAASADAYTTPADVIDALNTMSGLTRSTVEVHMHTDDVYISLWGNGKQEGRAMDPNAKAKWNATIDVVQGAVKIRAKIQAGLYQNVLYVKLDSLDGSVDDLLGSLSWSLLQKQWVKIPLDETLGNELPLPGMLNDPSIREMLNSIFSMEQKRFPGGYTYTLVPSDNLRTQLDLPAGAKIEINGKVDTDVANNLLFVKISGEIQDPLSGLSLTFKGDTQPTSERVNVDIPKEAMTLEEMERHLGALSIFDDMTDFSDFSDFSIPSGNDWEEDMMEDEWTPGMDTEAEADWDSDWSGIEEEPADVEMPTWIDGCMTDEGTPERVLELRRGLCNPESVGRGQVRRMRR